MHLASSCSGVLAAGIFMVLNCGAPLVADELKSGEYFVTQSWSCLLYTSDAADES